MACKIKYIENNYRKEYPELADKLSEIHNNVWRDVINSKLFTQKGNIPTESTYLFSKIGTEANKKQIAFVNSIINKYGGKVIIPIKTKDGFNTKIVVGINSIAQLEYDKLQTPVQADLFNNNINNINNLGKIINDGLNSEQENLGNNRKKLSSDYTGTFRQYFTNLEQNGKESEENTLYEQNFGSSNNNRLLSYDNKNFEQMFKEFDGSELQKNRLSAFITDRFIEEFNRNSALSKFSNGGQERINLNVIYEKSNYSIFEYNKNIYINIEGTSLVNNFKTAFDKGVNLDDFVKIALFEEIIHVITNKIGEKELKEEFVANKRDFNKIGKDYSNLYNFQTTNDVSSEILRMQVQNDILGLITEEVSKSTSDKNVLQQVLQYLLDLFGIKFKIHKEVFDKTVDYILKNTTKEKFKNDFFNDNIDTESLKDKITKLLPNVQGIYKMMFPISPLESLYTIAVQAHSSEEERQGAVKVAGEEMVKLAEETYPMASVDYNYNQYLIDNNKQSPLGISNNTLLETIIDGEIVKNKDIFEKETGYDENTTFNQIEKEFNNLTKKSINETIKKTNPDLKFTVTFGEKTLFSPELNTININLEEIYALSTYSNLSFNTVLNMVVMHELRHAQTSYGINYLKTGTESQKAQYKQFEDFLNKLKEINKTNPFDDKLRGSYTYAGNPYTYLNVDEMVADLYSNPFFKEYLQSIKYDKKQTFMQKIVDLINQLLKAIGIEIKDKNTLYDELNSLIKEHQIIALNYQTAFADSENLQMSSFGAATLESVYKQMDKQVLIQEIAAEFDNKKPELKASLLKIKKAFREKGTLLPDGSLKTSMKNIIQDLDNIEEGKTNAKSIISIIYSTLSVFKDLDIEAQKIKNEPNIDVKLQGLYKIYSIALEHQDFLDVLGEIKGAINDINEEGVSVLSSALTPEQKAKNSTVNRDLLRVLNEPLIVMENIKRIYNTSNEALVIQKVYDDNFLVATASKQNYLNQIDEITKKLEKATINKSPKQIIDLKKSATGSIKKILTLIKKLPLIENDNGREWIQQKTGDINVINLWAESNTVSRNSLVQTLASKAKDNELKAKDVLYPILNTAQGMLEKFLKDSDQSRIDTVKLNMPFLEEYTKIDKVVWNKETKDFDITTHKQFGLLNIYTDEYQHSINLFKTKLQALYYAIQEEKDINLLNKLKEKVEVLKKQYTKFSKKNTENKYIKEVEEALTLLDEDIKGTTLREYRSHLYDIVNSLEIQIADLDLLESVKITLLENLQEAQIQLKGLSSTFSKDVDSIEYKMAIQSKKYNEQIRKYRVSTISDSNMNLWKREKAAQELLYQKAIGKANEEQAKKTLDEWYTKNTKITIDPAYFDKRKNLADKLESLRQQLIEKGVITSTDKEKSKEGYTTLKDINIAYREFDGQINGNLLSENASKTIKEIQEELEKLRNELDTKMTGLTSLQQEQYNTLNLNKNRTDEEDIDFQQLDAIKTNANIKIEQNKDLVGQYESVLKELLDISEGGTTRFYDTQMDILNTKLENKIIDLLNSDTPVEINERIIIQKVENGWINTLTDKKVSGNTIKELLYKKYKDEVITNSEWYQANHYIKTTVNKKGVIKKEYEPLYQWKTSNPKDREFVKEGPSLKYYTTSYKKEALNTNYKTTPSRLVLPQEGKFVNEKFNSLTKDQKEYLEYLRSTYYNFQLTADNENSLNGDFIPSKQRTAYESNVELLKGNIVNNIQQRFNDSFTRNEQDSDEGFIKKDAIAGKVIPTYMSSRIESKNQSVDILGLILEYGFHAEKRKGLVNLQAFGEGLVNASKKYSKNESSTSLKGTTGFLDKLSTIGKILRGKDVPTNTTITTQEGVESNSTKALIEAVNTILYGEKTKGSDNSTVSKVADSLMKITAKGVFFLNAVSPIKNTISAKLQFFISSVGSQKKWLKAEATFMNNIPALVKDMHKFGNKSYLGSILEMYEGLQGSVFESISKKVQSNIFKEGANIVNGMKTFSEYELQAVFTIMMLQQKMIEKKDGAFVPLFDAYTQLKDGSLILKDEIASDKYTEAHRYDFIKNLHKLNLETQGAYRSEERNNAQKTIGGKLLFFMSQYFVPMVTNRYAKERYYRGSGEFQQGFYRMAWKTLIKDWNEYGTNVVQRWDLMSEEEKLATIKFLKELSVILTVLALIAVLGGNDPDRFKNLSKQEMFIIALLKGISSETQTASPFGGADEILRKIKTPFIVSKTLYNIAKLFIYTGYTAIGDDDAFYKQNTSIFKKGDSKAFATFMQLTGFSLSNIFNTDGELLLKRQENITRLR